MLSQWDADVLVIGAGASGIPAAIAAARAGARVVLLEEDPVPGGAPVDQYVAMPAGGPITGIYAEMLARLAARYPMPGRPTDPKLTWWLPSYYLAVIWEMLTAERNLRLICGVQVSAPLTENADGRQRVTGAVFPMPDGSEGRLRAKVTIDATGNGLFAERAGCEARYGREARGDFGEAHAPAVADNLVQECTWMYIAQRVAPGPSFDWLRLPMPALMKWAPPLGNEWIEEQPGAGGRRDAGIYLLWPSKVRCRDTRDHLALVEAQAEAHRMMEPDILLLHENGYMVHLAPKLGVREVRRIVGEHTITENDLRSGRLPEDTIAIGTYELDIWGESDLDCDRGEHRLPPYGIPYRALVPKGVDGLLVTGKILSGTHIAMSAYRVQPIVAVAGQAAGVAAAQCALEALQPRDADAPRIRQVLGGPGQGVRLTVG